MIFITVKEILFTQKTTLYKDTNVLQGNIFTGSSIKRVVMSTQVNIFRLAWSSGKKDYSIPAILLRNLILKLY